MTAAPIAASNAVGEIGVTLVGRAGGGRGVNFGASPGAVGDVGHGWCSCNHNNRVGVLPRDSINHECKKCDTCQLLKTRHNVISAIANMYDHRKGHSLVCTGG